MPQEERSVTGVVVVVAVADCANRIFLDNESWTCGAAGGRARGWDFDVCNVGLGWDAILVTTHLCILL